MKTKKKECTTASTTSAVLHPSASTLLYPSGYTIFWLRILTTSKNGILATYATSAILKSAKIRHGFDLDITATSEIIITKKKIG